MDSTSVWLIYNKASLGEFSPKNLDGSEFMVGVGVVPAIGMKEALAKFDEYLANEEMAVIEVTKCVQYDSKDFSESTEESREIRALIPEVLEEGKIFYACGVSSEVLAMEEDDDGQ